MLDINEYIVEKLKINKDTKINPHTLKDDEYIFCFGIESYVDEFLVRFYLFKLMSHTKNSITYKTAGDKYVSQDIIINKYGYIQVEHKKNELIAIYLNKKEGIKFIEELLDDKDNKSIYLKYVDGSKTDIPIEKTIKDGLPFYNNFERLKEFKNRLQNEKPE